MYNVEENTVGKKKKNNVFVIQSPVRGRNKDNKNVRPNKLTLEEIENCIIKRTAAVYGARGNPQKSLRYPFGSALSESPAGSDLNQLHCTMRIIRDSPHLATSNLNIVSMHLHG